VGGRGKAELPTKSRPSLIDCSPGVHISALIKPPWIDKDTTASTLASTGAYAVADSVEVALAVVSLPIILAKKIVMPSELS